MQESAENRGIVTFEAPREVTSYAWTWTWTWTMTISSRSLDPHSNGLETYFIKYFKLKISSENLNPHRNSNLSIYSVSWSGG